MNEILQSPEVLNVATTVLSAILSAVGIVGVGLIKQWTKTLKADAEVTLAKTEETVRDSKRKLLFDSIYAVENLANKTVRCIEQTAAEQMREGVKDGKVDKDELEALGRIAASEILSSLSDEYLDAIKETFGNMDVYIKKVVETAVYDLKRTEDKGTVHG